MEIRKPAWHIWVSKWKNNCQNAVLQIMENTDFSILHQTVSLSHAGTFFWQNIWSLINIKHNTLISVWANKKKIYADKCLPHTLTSKPGNWVWAILIDRIMKCLRTSMVRLFWWILQQINKVQAIQCHRLRAREHYIRNNSCMEHMLVGI